MIAHPFLVFFVKSFFSAELSFENLWQREKERLKGGVKSLNLSAFPISLLDRLGIVRTSLDCSTRGTLPGKHHALVLHRFSKDRSSSKYLYKILSFLLAPRFQHNVSGKLLESGVFFS